MPRKSKIARIGMRHVYVDYSEIPIVTVRKKRIGTHDDYFRCSEVLACALLKLLPQYKDASIERSRDKSVLDTCDIVVGAGREYDPSRHRYDHNTENFKESMSTIVRTPGYNWTVELTSAGLIYCHFGHEILRNVLSDVNDDKVIREMFKIIYFKVIKEIDARANDLPWYGAEPLFLSLCTDLCARIERLNRPWHRQYEEEKQFEKAVTLAQKEFLETVQNVKNFDLPQIDALRRAVESRFEVDSSGEIIILSASILCEDLLFYVEKDMNVSLSIKYVISELTGSRNHYYWKIVCILVALRSYTYRMLLPQAWGGLESDALVEACGVEGALYVAPDRVIGFHKTKDGAIAMAREALKIGKTVQDEGMMSIIQRSALFGGFSNLLTMSGKSTVRIGTYYEEYFYCSEVLACALLKLLPRYKDASIERSEDRSVLDTCDIVVGVGGEYDPSKHQYDHNIKDFKESMSTIIRELGYDSTIKLTTAGLIYCHFGREILRNVLSDVTEDRVIGEMFKIIYIRLIKEIDARDKDSEIYLSLCTDLTARIYKLNSPCRTESEKEKQFEKAVTLAQQEFLEIIQKVKNFDLPRIDILRRAVESRFKVDPSGEIIILSDSVLHKEYLFYLEKNMNVSPSIKYIICKTTESGDYYWIECVPVALKNWLYRMSLPQAWGGLQNDALVEACGIEGALFVFLNRCRGGHKTKDGAVAMARKALEIGKTVPEPQEVKKNYDVWTIDFPEFL